MRKAAAGVTQLNTALQALLNPPSPQKAELLMGRMATSPPADDGSSDSTAGVIRQGDRVIQTSNDYEKDVFNGDIGFVSRVNKAERTLVVKFPGESACCHCFLACTQCAGCCMCTTSTMHLLPLFLSKLNACRCSFTECSVAPSC